MIKKNISFFLTLLFICGILIGCNNAQNGSESSELVTESYPELVIASDGETEFTIRVADDINSESAALKEAVSNLHNAIFEMTGARLSITADRKYNEEDASHPAILIGRTQDAESQTIGAMRIDEFVISMSGNKVVICAEHAEGAITAIKYFINKIIIPQSTGNNKTLIFNESHCFTYTATKHAIKSINCLGAELGTYRMVIPENANINERMTANMLRHHLVMNYAYDLEIVEDTETSVQYEILIGNTSRTTVKPDANNYIISAENGKLQINADGMLGYENLTDHLRNDFFKAGNDAEYTIEEGFSYSGEVVTKLSDGTHYVTNRVGEVRCMFNNIYGWPSDSGPVSVKQDYQIEVFKAYRPDVIGLQEHTTYYRGSFDKKLSDIGYTKVEVADTDNYTPLYYRDDILDVIDRGFLRYTEGGDASKSVTWALFETATGERFIAMSTHFMWDSPDITDPNAIRKSNATELLALINELHNRYDDPIIVGGDLNCNISSEPLKLLCDKLLVAQEHAVTKNNNNGAHGFATYDEMYKYYTSYIAPGGTYSGSAIDHILTTDDVQIEGFGTICNDYTLYTSDHSPVLIDFTLK